MCWVPEGVEPRIINPNTVISEELGTQACLLTRALAVIAILS